MSVVLEQHDRSRNKCLHLNNVKIEAWCYDTIQTARNRTKVGGKMKYLYTTEKW
jgi:hypothetical protein